MNQSYDCIVLGGGPAGSTVAALVAEHGFRTLLLERDQFPRFHVGESLMPETYWTLKRLGVLDQVRASSFPKKYSVQFVSNSGRESQPFYFFEIDPHESSQTWQVLRSEFDQMLFENAARKGADCRERTRVLEVLFDGPRAVGVRVQRYAPRSVNSKQVDLPVPPVGEPLGPPEEIRGRVIVDATGQQSLIASRMGLREIDPKLRNASIWSYYRGARRDTGYDSGATIILHTADRKAWFWYIPLADDITSVGVVGQSDYLLRGRSEPEAIFEEELVKCPAVAERLMHASLAGDFHVIKDFSYVSRQAAGDGWVLVGDAFGFLDPIYSSGVFLALKSGEMAADAIVEGFARGDTSGTQLGKWAESFVSGLEWIKKLVYAFYTRDFSFGKFMMHHPEHKRGLVDLLVGRVFHAEAGRIFDDLDPWLSRCEQGEMPAMTARPDLKGN